VSRAETSGGSSNAAPSHSCGQPGLSLGYTARLIVTPILVAGTVTFPTSAKSLSTVSTCVAEQLKIKTVPNVPIAAIQSYFLRQSLFAMHKLAIRGWHFVPPLPLSKFNNA
jgi:hypothetical protein